MQDRMFAGHAFFVHTWMLTHTFKPVEMCFMT